MKVMLNLPKPDKITTVSAVLILCLLVGYCFAKIYQPQAKTISIYKQALENYENKDYSNAYYLFSKIGTASILKPAAIYRQSLCAKALEDSKSELINYQAFLRYYPKNPLATEVKYKAAQLLQESNPEQAEKYFEELSQTKEESDYKIASEYYLSKIRAKNGADKSLQDGFRNYLLKHPDGRLATEAAKSWAELNPEMTSFDKSLAAKAYLYAGDTNSAGESLKNTDLKDSWAVKTLFAKQVQNIPQLKDLVEIGVSQYPDTVNAEDFKKAVNAYIKSDSYYYGAASNLFNIAKGSNKAYIWNLKCRYAPAGEKLSCYNGLYANYLNNEHSEEFIPYVVLYRVLNRDFDGAKQAAEYFINKYPQSVDMPMVLFWYAKANQYTNSDYLQYYKDVMNNYPDSYYAYRAFWITNGLKSAVINAKLEYKPVELPVAVSGLIRALISVGDYELIEKAANDEFVKSWAQYQQGKYATSIHTAKLAMDNLNPKPPKSDPRWLLVYPMNYNNEIFNAAQSYNNNIALMFALTREESAFNPNAGSSVGAMGLMQLMPETAYEVYGYTFDKSKLFEPDFNIKLGNMYYSSLRKQLNNMDISAVASYNGGIGSLYRWKTNLIYSDTDEFIEQIPYEETRDYVKKVFRSYWNYTRIYQK